MTASPPPQLLADFHRAEATLPAIDDAAVKRLPERARRIFAAIAALDRGDRRGVRDTAAAIRAAGGDDGDIAVILEQTADPSPTKRVATGDQGPIPGLHEALASWSQGNKPRGSAALRERARGRPLLSALLELLGRRRNLHLEVSALEGLSPRLRTLMILTHALNEGRRAAAPPNLRRAIGVDDRVGVDRYLEAAIASPIRVIREWADDPRIEWTEACTRAATDGATGSRDIAHSVMTSLLRGIHARLVAGRASAAREGLAVAPIVAERARLDGDLVRALEVAQRRLGGLLTPRSTLPALLTLWRRSLGRPPAERLVIARVIVDGLLSRLAHGETPPAELPFAVEAVVYLFSATDDDALRARIAEELGMLLPAAKVAEVMARSEPNTRRRVLGLHALAQGRLGEAMDDMVALAQDGATAGASVLLERVLDWLHFARTSRGELRHFERAITALAAVPRARLEPHVLPLLLWTAEDLQVASAPIESLVRAQLSAPLPDGDLALAEALIACAVLGDDVGVEERVRGLGRWLRRGAPSPDVADDVALGILARVHEVVSELEEPEPTRRALAPLTAFVLREGPERALRAAMRAGAASATKASGYGAWARAHRDRLGAHPYWDAVIDLADALDDEDAAPGVDFDFDGDFDGENPF